MFGWIGAADDKGWKYELHDMSDFRCKVYEDHYSKPCIGLLITKKLSSIHGKYEDHIIITNLSQFNMTEVLRTTADVTVVTDPCF